MTTIASATTRGLAVVVAVVPVALSCSVLRTVGLSSTKLS
jgi:hypothetical protein